LNNANAANGLPKFHTRAHGRGFSGRTQDYSINIPIDHSYLSKKPPAAAESRFLVSKKPWHKSEARPVDHLGLRFQPERIDDGYTCVLRDNKRHHRILAVLKMTSHNQIWLSTLEKPAASAAAHCLATTQPSSMTTTTKTVVGDYKDKTLYTYAVISRTKQDLQQANDKTAICVLNMLADTTTKNVNDANNSTVSFRNCYSIHKYGPLWLASTANLVVKRNGTVFAHLVEQHGAHYGKWECRMAPAAGIDLVLLVALLAGYGRFRTLDVDSYVVINVAACFHKVDLPKTSACLNQCWSPETTHWTTRRTTRTGSQKSQFTVTIIILHTCYIKI
jgi:hypothetical protein